MDWERDSLSSTYATQRKSWIGGIVLIAALIVSSCAKKLPPASDTVGPAKLSTGSSWIPNVTGAGSGNNKGTVTITKTETLYTGKPMVRLNEAWTGKEVTINLGTYSASDFGPNGSISLVAEVQNYPTVGGAYAVLSSFSVDGTEYVAVNATCTSSGMYSCATDSSGNTYCSANACTVTNGQSAFAGRSDWDQHQIPPFGYVTTNTFPRCDPSVNSWTCPAAFSGQLKAGTYTAKYILLSDSGSSMAGQTVNLKITKIVKKDTAARGIASATNGALNLNVILVGDTNIADARTTKGAQNLNLLYQEVNNILKNASGVGLGTINVFEWANADGGTQWSAPDYEDLGTMFLSGSAGISLVNPSLDGDAINVFMVRDIQSSSSFGTILGLSGGILGAYINGTETSGVAFSTYISGVSSPRISGYNASCTLASCPRSIQEDGFLEMAATIAHELGHYVGLNHPSERRIYGGGAQRHDQLDDTPKGDVRLTTDSYGDPYYAFDQLSVYNDSTNTFNDGGGAQSCATACDAAIGGGNHYFDAGDTNPYNPRNYCATVPHCQFNYLMWWSTKNRKYTSGSLTGEDGNLISTQSSAIVQWNPFVK